MQRVSTGTDLHAEWTAAYCRAFRQHGVHAVLAEYGPTATQVHDACLRLGLPLTVHFHGYDAAEHATLTSYAAGYRQLFARRARIVVVSRAMKRALVDLGAPPETVFHNPYGVDCSHFQAAEPESNPPLLLSVGRLVEKKAPHLTLEAFAKAAQSEPLARLRMVGTGPLAQRCQELASKLGIDGRVEFAGALQPETVPGEMRRARAFVQHSVTASTGDAEGSPVSITEAAASGLPVVSTRHAGISDLVLDAVSGFLVEEGDVDGMATYMRMLLQDCHLAGKMGRAGRDHIVANFDLPKRIAALRDIVTAPLGTDDTLVAARNT
ncbi:MAG: glycosyltransferase [Vicinamibacterales bacterium]